MKLLVDTSVWSLALRRRSGTTLQPNQQQLVNELTEAISDGRVVMIGPIRQELLSGIREQAQFERLRQALAAFPDEPMTTADYEASACSYNLCRTRGLQCGPVDMLICTVAARCKWRVLTCDAGMLDCLKIILESIPE